MMCISLQIRECEPKELPAVVERLDQEFVFSKQRSVSLSKRFPNTLSVDNIKQIRVAVSDEVILGALSIRMFEWVIKGQVWHGAMVGMVWVDSLHRGESIGSKLLASARQFLDEADVDFGVLWTEVPAFYERAGWFLSDRGLFGEAANRLSSSRIATVSWQPVVSVDAAWLEGLRASSLPMRLSGTLSTTEPFQYPPSMYCASPRRAIMLLKGLLWWEMKMELAICTK